MPNFVLLLETLLKVLNLLAEQVVHLQFFLDQILEFLYVRVDIEVDITNSLHF